MNHSQSSAQSRAPDAIPNGKRRLSLRRFLAIVACIGVFFVSSWLASANGIEWATLPAIASAAVTFGLMTRRLVRSSAIVIILALLSRVTTLHTWDGGFPFAQIRIRIVDDQGNPIEKATLDVNRRPSGSPAVEYPITEYKGSPLISDSSGTIVCHQTRRGLQFGGAGWLLFWCIPMGAKAPQFDVHFAHPDYVRKSFRIWRLFESKHKFYEDFPKAGIDIRGRSEEIPIYEQRIVMSKR